MKKLTIFFLLLIFIIPLANAQEKEKKEPQKVKNFNLIKIGSSIQGDVYFGHNYYDIYYGDYYNYYDQYNDGYTATTFVAYEHIWEFPNKIALALEPKTGVSFRKYSTNFFIGNDLKFYWANLDIWRMGIALSSDYYYGSNKRQVVVSMDNGHYQQRVESTMNSHFLNFDIAIIPFQFRLKNIPLVFEMQFSTIGLGVYINKTETDVLPDGSTRTFSGSEVYPYFFKTEFKIGFVLP